MPPVHRACREPEVLFPTPGRHRLARAARVGTRGALVRYAGGRRPMNIPTIEKIRKSTNNT